MNDIIRQWFIKVYKEDRIYSKIIQDLCPLLIGENEEFLNRSKFGHTFRLTDGLFYSKDNDDVEHLVVLFLFI